MLMKDSSGSFIAAMHTRLNGVFQPKVAEALGVRGPQMAQVYKHRHGVNRVRRITFC